MSRDSAKGVPLRAIQEWLATVATHPETVPAGVAAARGLLPGVDGVEDVGRAVKSGPRLSPVERLEIYHRAYHARLIECLADDYPALAHAIGAAPFEALCRAYIAAHPSRSPNLNGYGQHMPAFCTTRPDPWRDFGADLAALEWAMVETIHAPTAGVLSLEALQSVPPERWGEARFRKSPGVKVLRFAHPTNAYYQAFRDEASLAIPPPAPTALAVYRRGFTIWRMDLTPAMVAVLESLFAGDPLGTALLAATPAPETNITSWFQAWVEAGFFTQVEVP